MQFRDLKKQYYALKSKLDLAMIQTAEQGVFIGGSAVRDLEQRLAKYVGRKHVITCANGTDALVILLKAYGIGEGDAVFVPDFTFFASAESIRSIGAIPIFVDVSPETFNIDVSALKKAIIDLKSSSFLKPKAIMAVDLFGLPAQYLEIEQLAKDHDLFLFEDAAQGFGGSINGQHACNFGHAATTSFFPAKPLGCYGDGGAIFIDDDEKATLIRSLCVHGKGDHKYDNVRIGYNSRLDTIQAAILLVKLDAFESNELQAVNEIAKCYQDQLSNLPAIQLPIVPNNMFSSWAQYTLRLENLEQRDQLSLFLKSKNIPTMIYYPKTMSAQTAFLNIQEQQVQNCCIAKKLCDTVLSIPMHPYLERNDIEYICSAIIEYVK